MGELSANLLSRAIRVFLRLAYPDGAAPARCQPYASFEATDGCELLLRPPVCQPIMIVDSNPPVQRGYALRLGSSAFPHIKLQVVWMAESNGWIFGVDTHDALHLRDDDPDRDRLRELQAKNRKLKAEIEQAWEAEGLLTFHTLLRAGQS